MKINYNLIRKIHLYACLSTVAVFAMFIFTSYIMIHHNWFSHEPERETETVELSNLPASEQGWQALLEKHQIKGRLVGENTDQNGHPFRNYATAEGSARITLLAAPSKAEIQRTAKSTADAIVGVHRQRGYGPGPLQYNLYAFLLDIMAVSLLLFTITGIILWFKLLKNHKIAWIIFIGGFIYFAVTMAVLMYW